MAGGRVDQRVERRPLRRPLRRRVDPRLAEPVGRGRQSLLRAGSLLGRLPVGRGGGDVVVLGVGAAGLVGAYDAPFPFAIYVIVALVNVALAWVLWRLT